MITIPTGDLTGVLADVVPFAFDNDVVPEINCVRIEWDGDRLHALATDRYRLGISTWEPGDEGDGEAAQDDLFTEWGGADDPWGICIALDEAKELVKVFKLGPKEQHTPLTIDHDAERRHLKVVRGRETGHSAITVVAPDTFVEFPNLRAMLSKHDTLEPVTGLAFTTKLLADFSKVRPRGPMELRFTGETGTALVAIGQRFVGAIQPVRVGS